MRLLHTSDWHLGKRLFKLDRTPEHEHFLDWLLLTLKERKIDVLLIAGDIFDVPTPPHQSLELYYNFLHRVSTETQAQTLIIAGNHDSGLLLEAPNKLLAPHRIKVWGKLATDPAQHWHTLDVEGEKLQVCALPFFRSYELLPHGEGDIIEAFKRYVTPFGEGPKLLMLHHLAGMAEAAGSEQVVNLSGVNSIPLEILQDFDYVALGHIHKPQKMGESIYYSGSPLPMRFSETHPKSVIELELREGKFTLQHLPIPSARELHIVKCGEDNWREKIRALPQAQGLMPMVEVQISLPGPKVGLIDEIKKVLSDKGMELLSYLPSFGEQKKTEKTHDKLFELSPLELFQEFYVQKYPKESEVPEDLIEDFKLLLEKVKDASSQT